MDFPNWYGFQKISFEQHDFYARRHRLKFILSLQKHNFLLNWLENSPFDSTSRCFISKPVTNDNRDICINNYIQKPSYS